METHIPRGPNAAYAGQNGFIRGFTEPEEIEGHNIQNALENHRTAMFVINEKKRSIPDFETMKAQAEEPNMLLTTKENLKTLHENHTEDLERLYAYHTTEYEQEMLDRRFSNDESWSSDPSSDPAAKLQLQHIKSPEIGQSIFQTVKAHPSPQKLLYTGPFKDAALEAQWQDDYEKLRYTYVSQLTALEKERRDLEREQEAEKKRREKMFPQSIEDFRRKPKDVQLRTARFLVGTTREKEGMLAAFEWAWRQTAPLEEIFKNDERFAAEMRAIKMTTDHTTDPRRARA